MNCFHKFKFKTESTGKPIYVYMDGEELKGLTQAKVDWGVDQIPSVKLTFITTEIEIDIEDCYVEVNKK